MKNYSKLIDLANKNNGYIFSKDVVVNNISKDYLKFAVDDGEIEKVGYGVYILPDTFIDELYVLQKTNNKIIYSAFTSAYLLELTTRNSGQIYASVPLPYHSPKLKEKGIFVREEENIYNLGINEVITSFGNVVKCHDIHRTICDLFSLKFIGDKFVQIESLKNYLKRPDRDIIKLMEYAKQLNVDKQLRDRLEVLI